jgi:hypothetical protein
MSGTFVSSCLCIGSTTARRRALDRIVLARRQCTLGRDVLSAENRTPADSAEDDALLVDDEAGIPAALVELLAHGVQAVIEAAAGTSVRR